MLEFLMLVFGKMVKHAQNLQFEMNIDIKKIDLGIGKQGGRNNEQWLYVK